MAFANPLFRHLGEIRDIHAVRQIGGVSVDFCEAGLPLRDELAIDSPSMRGVAGELPRALEELATIAGVVTNFDAILHAFLPGHAEHLPQAAVRSP